MAGEWGKTPEWMILLLSYFMTALTSKLKVIKASEQPVLGFQNTTKSCLSKADEVVMSFSSLQIRWTFPYCYINCSQSCSEGENVFMFRSV